MILFQDLISLFRRGLNSLFHCLVRILSAEIWQLHLVVCAARKNQCDRVCPGYTDCRLPIVFIAGDASSLVDDLQLRFRFQSVSSQGIAHCNCVATNNICIGVSPDQILKIGLKADFPILIRAQTHGHDVVRIAVKILSAVVNPLIIVAHGRQGSSHIQISDIIRHLGRILVI